jgi:hypothetical protein
MCRLAYAYPDGAAPYYTVLAPGRRGEELAQWDAVKRAASDAILAAGGTITHHHTVGRDHRPWYDQQRPEPFALALRGAKAAVDPHGMLLAARYAPGVLAGFGAGPERIEVRAVAAGGAHTYRAGLASDLAGRRAAGHQLLRNPSVGAAATARAELAAGRVDSRLLITLATMAAAEPVRVLSFGDSGPAAGPGVPLRAAEITAAARPARCRGQGRSAAGWPTCLPSPRRSGRRTARRGRGSSGAARTGRCCASSSPHRARSACCRSSNPALARPGAFRRPCARWRLPPCLAQHHDHGTGRHGGPGRHSAHRDPLPSRHCGVLPVTRARSDRFTGVIETAGARPPPRGAATDGWWSPTPARRAPGPPRCQAWPAPAGARGRGRMAG